MTQQQLNLEMLKALKRMEQAVLAPQAAGSANQPPPLYIAKPPNPFAPNQRPQYPVNNPGRLNLTCYNCIGVGHMSTACQEERVSDAQYSANRQKVKAARSQRAGYIVPQ